MIKVREDSEMTDAEATELDMLILESFRRQLFEPDPEMTVSIKDTPIITIETNKDKTA